jgi:hypothetical protein
MIPRSLRASMMRLLAHILRRVLTLRTLRLLCFPARASICELPQWRRGGNDSCFLPPLLARTACCTATAAPACQREPPMSRLHTRPRAPPAPHHPRCASHTSAAAHHHPARGTPGGPSHVTPPRSARPTQRTPPAAGLSRRAVGGRAPRRGRRPAPAQREQAASCRPAERGHVVPATAPAAAPP